MDLAGTGFCFLDDEKIVKKASAELEAASFHQFSFFFVFLHRFGEIHGRKKHKNHGKWDRNIEAFPIEVVKSCPHMLRNPRL